MINYLKTIFLKFKIKRVSSKISDMYEKYGCSRDMINLVTKGELDRLIRKKQSLIYKTNDIDPKYPLN